jgi:Nucleotidyltransferase of unknown function (DUF6036)
MQPVEALFVDIDRRWKPPVPGHRQVVPIIGASALMLATEYQRGTKDSDVLQTSALDACAAAPLETLAGLGSDLHRRHRLYVEVVPEAFPFLPRRPRWNRAAFAASLTHLDIDVLDVVDIVVRKLRRFHGSDRDDVDAMIALGLVVHSKLIERFQDAFDTASETAAADALPRCVRNLNQVERDAFGVEPSVFEYPPWVDDAP